MLKWMLVLPRECELHWYFDACVALLYFAAAEHSQRSCIPSSCFCLSGKVKEEKIKEKTKLQENHGKPFWQVAEPLTALCILEELYLIPPPPQITTFAYYQRLWHWCLGSPVLHPFLKTHPDSRVWRTQVPLRQQRHLCLQLCSFELMSNWMLAVGIVDTWGLLSWSYLDVKRVLLILLRPLLFCSTSANKICMYIIMQFIDLINDLTGRRLRALQ